jgi:hypothetical protein
MMDFSSFRLVAASNELHATPATTSATGIATSSEPWSLPCGTPWLKCLLWLPLLRWPRMALERRLGMLDASPSDSSPTPARLPSVAQQAPAAPTWPPSAVVPAPAALTPPPPWWCRPPQRPLPRWPPLHQRLWTTALESGAALGAPRAGAPLRPFNQLAKADSRKGPAHKGATGAIRGGGRRSHIPRRRTTCTSTRQSGGGGARGRRRRCTRSTVVAQEEGAV